MCSHVTTYGGGEGGGMGEREQRLSGRNGRDGAGVEWEGANCFSVGFQRYPMV